jgi:hypothetical protein
MIEPIVRLRQEIGRIDTEIDGLSRQKVELDQRASETRSNLEAIKKDPRAGELRGRLSKRLEEFTRDGDKLGRDQIVELQTEPPRQEDRARRPAAKPRPPRPRAARDARPAGQEVARGTRSPGEFPPKVRSSVCTPPRASARPAGRIPRCAFSVIAGLWSSGLRMRRRPLP